MCVCVCSFELSLAAECSTVKAAVWAQFGLPDPRTLHFAPLTNTSKSSQTQSLVTTGTALHWLQHQPHSHCPVRHQSLQHPPL